MGDRSRSSLKNHYFHCFITYSVGRKRCAVDYIGGRTVFRSKRVEWRGGGNAVVPYNSRVIRFEDTARRGV